MVEGAKSEKSSNDEKSTAEESSIISHVRVTRPVEPGRVSKVEGIKSDQEKALKDEKSSSGDQSSISHAVVPKPIEGEKTSKVKAIEPDKQAEVPQIEITKSGTTRSDRSKQGFNAESTRTSVTQIKPATDQQSRVTRPQGKEPEPKGSWTEDDIIFGVVVGLVVVCAVGAAGYILWKVNNNEGK